MSGAMSNGRRWPGHHAMQLERAHGAAVGGVDSGELVANLRAHHNGLQAMAFSPDDSLLVTKSWGDRMNIRWSMAPLELDGKTLLAEAEQSYGLRLDGARLRPIEDWAAVDEVAHK